MKQAKLYNGKTWAQLTDEERATERSNRAMGKGTVENAQIVESSNTLENAIKTRQYPTNLDKWNATQIKRVLSKADWHDLQIILNMIKHDTTGRFTLETVEYAAGYFTKKGGRTVDNIVIADRMRYAPKRTRYNIRFEDNSTIGIEITIEHGIFEIIQSSGNPLKRYIRR